MNSISCFRRFWSTLLLLLNESLGLDTSPPHCQTDSQEVQISLDYRAFDYAFPNFDRLSYALSKNLISSLGDFTSRRTPVVRWCELDQPEVVKSTSRSLHNLLIHISDDTTDPEL